MDIITLGYLQEAEVEEFNGNYVIAYCDEDEVRILMAGNTFEHKGDELVFTTWAAANVYKTILLHYIK